MKFIEKNDYEGTACKMRNYYKSPIYELIPRDELNHVPFIIKLRKGCRFLLGHPYPCLVDPTRTIDKVRRFKIFSRDEIEMHHMSMVRKNMKSKVLNVSNKNNYANVDQFLEAFEKWKEGDPIVHPHPYYQQVFQKVEKVENIFDIKI